MNLIMGPWNVNRGTWMCIRNLEFDYGTVKCEQGTWNVVMRQCNMIMGPWNLNRGPWNVSMGPRNMNRGSCNLIMGHVM